MSRNQRGASVLGLLAALILAAALGLAAYGAYKPSGTMTDALPASTSGQGPVAAAQTVALASAASAIVSTANANAAFNDGGAVTDASLDAAASEVTAGTGLTWTNAVLGTGYVSDGSTQMAITVTDGVAALG